MVTEKSKISKSERGLIILSSIVLNYAAKRLQLGPETHVAVFHNLIVEVLNVRFEVLLGVLRKICYRGRVVQNLQASCFLLIDIIRTGWLHVHIRRLLVND